MCMVSCKSPEPSVPSPKKAILTEDCFSSCIAQAIPAAIAMWPPIIVEPVITPSSGQELWCGASRESPAARGL